MLKLNTQDNHLPLDCLREVVHEYIIAKEGYMNNHGVAAKKAIENLIQDHMYCLQEEFLN